MDKGPRSVPELSRLPEVDDWTSLGDLQQELFPDLDEPHSAVAYVTRLIVATTLPHSQPADNEFTRNSGLYDLCLLAPRRVGLPSGIYPRLALTAIVTEAVQKKNPFVALGPSLSSFAWRLGITPSTGARGSLAQLREQLNRLANLTVSCIGDPERSLERGLPPAFSGGGVRLIKQYNFWWDDPPPSEDVPNFVHLSQDFYDEALAHPIPVSLDVLRSFRSPLAMDIYMWLTYRSVRATRIRRPELVSWKALQRQFGADYSETRMFRFNFLRALKNVLKAYPAARLNPTPQGLVLLPYPPHVPRLKER